MNDIHSEPPKLEFKPQRVKVTITGLFEAETACGYEALKERWGRLIESFQHEATGKIDVRFEHIP